MMPHDTFFYLSLPKRQRIESILFETVHHQPLSQAKVSDIVAKMGMSRRAFYKFFADLEDANNHMISILGAGLSNKSNQSRDVSLLF